MKPEDKIKEYIERAQNIALSLSSVLYGPEIINIAQMLQREEHFNNNTSLQEVTSSINTLADGFAEATEILNLNKTKE